ncbi:Pfam KH 3 [Fragilaria crotonensis]|nr:Pfam KH 3 [Fragilaria crotonensis]
MEQCHDCGEVVCKSCGTLLTCKFCGSALCDECATACAKCGIVLCGRDAKFAVDCDTCKLSYCLVCLASGQKETCIRCHTRPSKRMEQLVHLRLKSIYKAFQQSARINDAHPHLKRVALAAMKNAKEPTMDPILAKAQADAAAAELLAELEQEEEDSKPMAKKKRKKKKKGHDEDEVKEAACEGNGVMKEQVLCTNKNFTLRGQQPPVSHDQMDDQDHDDDDGSSILEISADHARERAGTSDPDSFSPSDDANVIPSARRDGQHAPQSDPIQARLCELVNAEDIQGIVDLLEDWKGVPGMAALRKNAKKALKRLKDQQSGQPQPRTKIISTLQKSATTRETLMEMDPSIVGFVIGRGGRKIRDLMDESGAKVWIDQESMEAHEPRIVYVSGAKKAVDVAVKMIQDIVKNADNPEYSVFPAESPVLHVVEDGDGKKAEFASRPSALIRDEIPCEARFVPLLIGRRGWTIKHIQDSSGAKVNIDQSVTPRLVTVTGTAESVETAKRLISDVLSYPHAQLKTDADSFVPDGMHSPPPSTYVMTGDVKSIVSPSSSLSSTPEPSMASSKGRELVGPPPGLFDSNRRFDGIPLAQSHVLSANGYNDEQFVQPHFGNTPQHQPSLQPPNLHQAQLIAPPGHLVAGMVHSQESHGHIPLLGQQSMPGLPPPHMQHQPQHAMHHQMNPRHTQNAMHTNPTLVSQHQLAMQQQNPMSMPLQHHNGFLSPPGNPNEASMRFGGMGMGQPQFSQPGDQQRQNLNLPSFRGTSDAPVQGMLHQAVPHKMFQPNYMPSTLQSKESIDRSLRGDGSALLPPASQLFSASAVPIEGVFPGVPRAAREESNLIDSMFAPSKGDSGHGLLAGLKGLAVCSDDWEGSSGLPEWKHETKGRPPIESRFHWGS